MTGTRGFTNVVGPLVNHIITFSLAGCLLFAALAASIA